MSLPAISTSSVLKRDTLFQLQRVTTHEGRRFLAKFAVSDLRGSEDALLEHEFEVFAALGSDRLPKPVRLDREGDTLTAYYEEIVGDVLPLGSLRDTSGGAQLVALSRAIPDLCAALAAFHNAGLIVAGMSPQSFLRDSDTGRCLLVDAPFARAMHAPAHGSDEHWLRSPYLAYAAPEVIGRLPFQIDARADLYALGAILYDLLARRPPFEADDPGGLIQCHLAKEPASLLVRQPRLPAGVAQVVMKLLAKSPDDRYESIGALEDALMQELGAVPISGARSRPPSGPPRRRPTPELSTKLYGMDQPLRGLQDKLNRTRTKAALTFVEGEAGVGKTSLVLQARALLPHGRFCRGRFVHTAPVAPLSGWASALRELADAVLTRDARESDEWRKRALPALGEGAALISVLVPEWAAIFGASARASEQAPDSGLNRLAIAIHALLRSYAEPDAPVVLVLDDLQWADSSSLRILELVLELPEPVNLLVLACVRSPSDVDDASADLDALRLRLDAAGVGFDRLFLNRWSEHEIRELLRDSFGTALYEADAFAELLLVRTHGNPFFVHELLRTLIQQGVLFFDAASSAWSWAPEAIRRLPPADNLVEFLTRRVLGLPAQLKDALRLASCLGTTFDLSELAVVADLSPELAAARLEPAISEGLLLPGRTGTSRTTSGAGSVQPSYEFAHDRVFEACRGLMRPDERASLSLSIGRTLLASYRDKSVDELAHKLAGYYNTGGALVTSDEERLVSAELNHRAGTLAKQSGAFSQSFEYFQQGLAFLRALSGSADGRERDEIMWLAHPELARSLFESAAEAALLNGHYELMHTLCAALLARVHTPLQKVRTYEIRVGGFSAEKRFPEAVAAACEILAELGVTFPRRPGVVHAIAGYLTTKRKLFSRSVARLIELPANRDPHVKAVSRIMQAMYSAAYLGHRNLFPLLVCRHIGASLKHGNEDYSCVTYIAFAIVLAAMGDFENAHRLATISLELQKSLGADAHKAKVYMGMYVFVFPWKHHLRDAIPYYVEAVAAGLEHGDFEYASHLLTLMSLARLHSGHSLRALAPELEQYRIKIGSLRQERAIILQQLLCQVVHDLREGSADAVLTGPTYDARAMLPRCLTPLDQNLVFHHHMARVWLCFLLGDRTAALAAAADARAFYDTGAFGIYLGAVFTFVEALLLLWSARTRPRGRARALRRAGKAARQLQRWAHSAPMNFAHKYHLVEAERCRARGLVDRSASHFDRAIELAHAHGYVQEMALAQELAAEFYLERGMERLGRHHLRECHASYRRWGALAVARRLERAYPQHFALLAAQDDERDSSPSTRFSEDLDYRVLLKSSQLISAELRLPNLLELLLRTMSEHAGAQRALLVLERRGQLHVEAEADVDRGSVELLRSEPADDSLRLCRAVVRYVARTSAPIVLADAATDDRFNQDPYVKSCAPKSVLCTPIVYQGRLLGVAYLENNRVTHVFSEARVEVANLLSAQAAISIATARFHALELEAQQARINPHFLFNALSSIAELALQDGPRTEEAIVKLAQLYRYVLATSVEQQVTLAQEIEMVRSYLALEKLRFGAKLEYFITCDDSVGGVRVPGLLVQPLVENAIRHAIAPKLTRGRVWVHASLVGELCRIVVQDDGDGQKHGTGGTGFGLRSVQERLGLLYRQEYGMAITRRGGYRVELTFPSGGPAPERGSGLAAELAPR